MSSAAVSGARAARAATSVGSDQQPGRPRLQVLGGKASQAHRIPFLVSCITLLCLGLAALLGINIGLSRGAYEVFQLQKEQQQLTESTQNLDEQLAYVSSPGVVSSRARALGMVPSGAPVFIQLSDGKILGDPKKAVAKGNVPSADLSRSSSGNPRAAAAQASLMQDAYATQRAAERAAQGTSGAVVPRPAAPASTDGSQATSRTSVGDGATPGR